MTTETTVYIAYGVVLQEDDVGYPDPFATAVDAAHNVSLECFGDANDCTRILCVESSVIKTQWQPLVLELHNFLASAHWDALLQDLCKQHDKKVAGDPSWLLFFTRL